MSVIECKITDSVLFSGSADVFRTANGGYWYEVEVGDSTYIEFETTSEDSPDFTYFDKIFMAEEHEKIDADILTLNKKAAIRIVSTGAGIKNDTQWNMIWMGGTFGNNTYNAIYTDSPFQYVNFTYSKPYSQLSASALTGDFASSVVQISYDYGNYLKEYEEYIARNTDMSELLLPNFYIMGDMSQWDTTGLLSSLSLYPTEMLDFLSRESTTAFAPNQFFDLNASQLPDVPPSWFAESESMLQTRNKNNNLAIEYLTSSFVNNELSASTKTWATTKMKTMLFDHQAIESFSSYLMNSELLPYAMKITFSTDQTGTSDFRDSINTNNFSSKFIKTLYQTFSNQYEDLIPSAGKYNKASSYYSGSLDGGVSAVSAADSVSYREIDYMELLLHSHNTYTDNDDEFMFVGPRTLYRYAAETESAAYRYVNTSAAIATLNDATSYLKANVDETEVTSWSDLYSDKERHIETVAYRIEKTGGPATGDSFTQPALQNFWFVNSEDIADFEFYDSQVKYDTSYTYKIYAYVLVQGIRYKFSDLKLSRKMGCEDDGDRVGLEFYNPTGDNPTSKRIYMEESTTSDFSDALSGSATYTTDAHIFSSYPYAADFYLNYEPVLKIVEIPIYSKTLKILDSPPNVLNITPFQYIGTENKLGFDITNNSFASKPYPSPITEVDEIYKLDYLHANDLTESDNLNKPTATNPRTVEVYRMTTKPTAVSDYQYYLHDTIDLKIPQQKYGTYGSVVYEDKITPNTSYYYLFRVLNEHGIQSHLTPVYEGRIINDGGYAYSLFNIFMESELEEKVYNNPTKHFKNLIQLQPNLSQMQFNTDDADFGNSAASEISNVTVGAVDDLIWDKTFKVRLTSKKTGKKIDLNITYNLRSE